MKRKAARPGRTRVAYRGVVHRVVWTTGGQRPMVSFACQVGLSAGGGLPIAYAVPAQAQFVVRDVDCMACIAEGGLL